jgi:aminoglycoside phosphotransferase (APT) family kinase protein
MIEETRSSQLSKEPTPSRQWSQQMTSNSPPSSKAAEPRQLPGLDVHALQDWLLVNEPELVGAVPLSAGLIAGGRSNLTYAIRGAAEPLVLRRPPLGHVQSTAHDMAREFRVISALRGSRVPVPRAVCYVDDSSAGVEGPFYLMERVKGRPLVTRDGNAAYTPSQLRELSLDLARTLAHLHSIAPDDVGLGDFGRPDGFLVRQVERWGKQYDGSRNRELPELDTLQRELHANIPETRRSSILHGDYRLDNALVRDIDGAPHLSAILDWEMATLGDSLTDLGLLGLYWNINSPDSELGGAVPSAVDLAAGYPTFEELVDEYSQTAGVTVPELPWYLGLAAFKLAVILEGIHFRFQAGQTVGPGFDQIGTLVTPLARAGRKYLAEA